MLMRALGKETGTGAVAFTDAAEIPTWMMGAVQAAVETGIIAGYDDGTFRPHENITRAQLAVMVARALSHLVLSDQPGPAPVFTDGCSSRPGLRKASNRQASAASLPATRAEALAMLVRLLALQ